MEYRVGDYVYASKDDFACHGFLVSYTHPSWLDEPRWAIQCADGSVYIFIERSFIRKMTLKDRLLHWIGR